MQHRRRRRRGKQSRELHRRRPLPSRWTYTILPSLKYAAVELCTCACVNADAATCFLCILASERIGGGQGVDFRSVTAPFRFCTIFVPPKKFQVAVLAYGSLSHWFWKDNIILHLRWSPTKHHYQIDPHNPFDQSWMKLLFREVTNMMALWIWVPERISKFPRSSPTRPHGPFDQGRLRSIQRISDIMTIGL